MADRACRLRVISPGFGHPSKPPTKPETKE
jgi:hypothetical protein